MKLSLRRLTPSLTALCLLLCAQFFSLASHAQAFCSLRDPVSAIHNLFPASDGFLSTVRVVDAEARNQIAQMLPFTIHYNELGKHTLYTALDDATPVGFVHVRSEPGPWGLMEVAWALSPELRVQDLSFQRCRSSVCNEPMRAALSKLVAGRSWRQLAELLSDDGSSLIPALSDRFEHNAPFVLAVIRSAMKTALVTQISWPQELARVMAIRLGPRSQAGSEEQLKTHKRTISESAAAQLRQRHGGLAIGSEDDVSVYALSQNQRPTGWMVTGQWEWNEQSGTAYWLFSEAGLIEGVTAIPAWPNETMAEAFGQLKGRTIGLREDCATAAELTAFELFKLASFDARH